MDSIPIPGAEILFRPALFSQPEEATQLFDTLLSKCVGNDAEARLGT